MAPEDTVRVEDIIRMEELNEYLKLGWVLLKIYTVDCGGPEAPSQVPHYVIGWQDKSREPEYPESVIKGRQEGNLPF